MGALTAKKARYTKPGDQYERDARQDGDPALG
jgi:hypothetical protein